MGTCRGLPVAVFFGKNDKAPMSSKETDRAKQVCTICPVRLDCLEAGLGEPWGVWGGFTKPERDRALQLLGTWLWDGDDLTIIPASADAVLAAFQSGLLEELVVLR